MLRQRQDKTLIKSVTAVLDIGVHTVNRWHKAERKQLGKAKNNLNLGLFEFTKSRFIFHLSNHVIYETMKKSFLMVGDQDL